MSAGKRLSRADAQRHKYSVMRRQMTLAANAEGATLKPWHKALALWLANQVEKPNQEEIRKQAISLTRQDLPKTTIKKLLMNPAFQAFRLEMEEQELAKAKQTMEGRMAKAVDQHFDALDKLMEGEQWKEVYKFTAPVLARVWPEDQAQRAPAQIITINLGGEFIRRHQGKFEKAIDITDVAEVSSEEVQA